MLSECFCVFWLWRGCERTPQVKLDDFWARISWDYWRQCYFGAAFFSGLGVVCLQNKSLALCGWLVLQASFVHCADCDHVFPCRASHVETWDRWTSLGGRYRGVGGGLAFCLVETKEEICQKTLRTLDAAPSCTGMQRSSLVETLWCSSTLWWRSSCDRRSVSWRAVKPGVSQL